MYDHRGWLRKWPQPARVPHFSSSSDSEEPPNLQLNCISGDGEVWEETNLRKLNTLGPNTAKVLPEEEFDKLGEVDSNLIRRVVEYLLDCYGKTFECAEDKKSKALALQEKILQMKVKILMGEQIEQADRLA